jgi:uncharacterized repeat protein (TIGR02543 family)
MKQLERRSRKLKGGYLAVIGVFLAIAFLAGCDPLTLTALKPPYSVTYQGNGNKRGTVPVDAAIYSNGQTVTVLGNTGSLTRSGYSFMGWNTAANGRGTNRAIGSTFAIGSENVVLYAKWMPLVAYSNTYDGKGITTVRGTIFKCPETRMVL